MVQASLFDLGHGGANSMMSSRFAPPSAQPTGVPAPSVASDHFQPDLRRSTGLLPVPAPAQGTLSRLLTLVSSSSSVSRPSAASSSQTVISTVASVAAAGTTTLPEGIT